MTDQEVIFSVIRDVLENPSLALDVNSSIETVEGWDSLAHVRIVLAIETEFDVRFDVATIPTLTSVKAILSEVA